MEEGSRGGREGTARYAGGGGGGGGLKRPLSDTLGRNSVSGEGGGGNSGDVEQPGGGASTFTLGAGEGGNGGGGLKGVVGAEQEVRGRGGGAGGPELLRESEVLEEREVEEDDMETEESREDFLSGILGLWRLPEGDMDRTPEGTGVPAVGVLDWLE